MSSTEPPRDDDLLDFFEELRRNGFNFGTWQYVAAQKLLVKLAAEGGWLDRPERLAALFAPIVCTTPEEQESFPHHYERWLQARPSIFTPKKKSLEEATPDKGPQRDAEPERKPPSAWNKWWLLLLVLPLLLTAFILVPLNSPSPPRQLTLNLGFVSSDNRPLRSLTSVRVLSEGKELAYPTSSTGQITIAYSTDDLPLELQVFMPDRQASMRPAPSPPRRTYLVSTIIQKPTTALTLRLDGTSLDGTSAEEEPAEPTWLERVWQFYRGNTGWAIALAAVVLLGGGLLWLGRQARRLELRKWRTRNRVKTDQLVVKGAAEQLSRILSLRRTAQELRRHRPSDVQDLDVSQTIEGTIRRGLFTPTYAARRSLPEYLVLIDRVGFEDQQARFVDEAVKRLASNDVYIERYYFQGDPRVCTKNEARARRHSAGGHVNLKDAPQSGNVTLQELTAKYPNHNLLVFSDGEGLFNPLTGRAQDWLGMFSSWSTRVFLTSELQPDDYMEWALNKSGFIVLPADRAGLAAASELIQTGIRLKERASRVHPLPRLLRQRQNRWLEEHPPAPSAIEELCGELRKFLGGEGYYWLSACAVYPLLYWDLTLYFGYRLVGQNRFDEKLTTLLRLPWFRHGSMPDWLRERLVIELPPAQEGAIRGALRELLLTSIRKPDGFVLPIVRDPVQEDPRAWRRAWGRFARRIAEWRDTAFLLDYLKSGQSDSPLRDHVLLSVMAGRKPDRLALRFPEELHAAFGYRQSAAAVLLFRVAAAFIVIMLGLSLLAVIAGDIDVAIVAMSVGQIVAWATHYIHAFWRLSFPQAGALGTGTDSSYSLSTPASAAVHMRHNVATSRTVRRWPFVVGRPLLASEVLYGRALPLAEIVGHLSRLIPVNLVGERRSGKTSLLNHLVLVFSGRATATFRPLLIHIDLQRVGPNTRNFYAVALRQLLDRARAALPSSESGAWLVPKLDEMNSRLFNEHDAEEFRGWLKVIRDADKAFHPVIVLDEFESLLAPTARDDLPEFFSQLRAMMSAGLMTMVVASARPLSEYSSDGMISDGMSSPFANYFMTLRLAPLGDADAEALLRGASDSQLTDGEIEETRRWAGGSPCLLQVAAAAWYEAKREGHPIEWVYKRREELKLQNCASSPPPLDSVGDVQPEGTAEVNVARELDKLVSAEAHPIDRDPESAPTPVRLFVSYAHEDERQLKRLDAILDVLEQQHGLAAWHDRRLIAGEEWDNEIRRRLEEMDIFLFIASQTSLVRPHVKDPELRRARERHAAGEVEVVTVKLEPCAIDEDPFLKKLQRLAPKFKSVVQTNPRSQAWEQVRKDLLPVIERARRRKDAARG